jgi:hypothetical protein
MALLTGSISFHYFPAIDIEEQIDHLPDDIDCRKMINLKEKIVT